ncbi:TPA: VanZ family protein [Neisseria meningitidis]
MMLPRNRFSLLSALWFAGGIYALLRPAETTPPPFPHFDKVAHLALFFAQTWLLTKAFRTESRPIPYRGLMVSALCFALFSECAQVLFTETRTGSFGDVLADMAGTVLALFAARAARRPD